MLPYSAARGRQAAPPLATTRSGCVPITQFMKSMLWKCCSTIWSPHSHRKEYQLRCSHSMSPHLASRAGGVGGDRLLGEDVLAGFHGGLEVNRAVARRRGQHNDIELAHGELLI